MRWETLRSEMQSCLHSRYALSELSAILTSSSTPGTRTVSRMTLYLFSDLVHNTSETMAMGFDDFHPLSKSGSNLGNSNGIGYTILDAIDTMFLMNLNNEYTRARSWVKKTLNFNQDGSFSTFEVSH
jgi:hypothetical protein